MARARLIKPSFFTNDLLAEVPPIGRLLFAGLWCVADREGRLEDRPARIKAEVLPYDDADVAALLDELEARRFIERYEVDGIRYIQIAAFTKHQSPHQREAPSTIPAPDKPGAHPVQAQPPRIIHDGPARPPSGSSPAVTVTVPIPDPVAVSGHGDPDIGFRDRYGTLVTAFGGHLDQRAADEFTQIAEDWTDIEAINAAIRACRRDNKRPWPSEVRARLPELPKPAKARPKRPDEPMSLDEFRAIAMADGGNS